MHPSILDHLNVASEGPFLAVDEDSKREYTTLPLEGAQWPLLLRLKSLASPHILRSSAPMRGDACPALCLARSQAPPEEKTSLCYTWTVTSKKESLLLLWGSVEPVRKPHWVWKLPGPLPATVSFTPCQVLNCGHFPESQVSPGNNPVK